MGTTTATHPKGQYREVSDQLLIRRLIAQAIETRAAVVLWFTGQTTELMRSHCHQNENAKKREPFFSIDTPEDFERHLQAMPKDSEALCSITLYLVEHGLLCFKAKIHRYDSKKISFEYPDHALVVQRRKSGRYKIEKAYEIEVHLRNPETRKVENDCRLADLNEFGLAFEAPIKVTNAFKRGAFIDSVSFRVNGQLIQCQGIVRSYRRGRNVQIGVEFINLGEVERDHLRHFILERMVQYMPDRYDPFREIKVVSRKK